MHEGRGRRVRADRPPRRRGHGEGGPHARGRRPGAPRHRSGEGEIAAENACGGDVEFGNVAIPRPIYTDPEIATVGLTESQARERYGDHVAIGRFPWTANARAVMQNETVGWVKSIHETRHGELVGLVIVGPHATDMVEAGVVAIDARTAVETVADGIAPHPSLSEAIRGAALVALGRAIDVPNRPRPVLASRAA